MPKLNDTTTFITPDQYRFTAAPMDSLGASEYTLTTIVCDISSSVRAYRDQLEECIKTVVDSCGQSPRSDNLLLRLCAFNNNLKELHGFKELSTIKRDDYTGILAIGGCTALFDASHEAISASDRYGQALTERGFGVNAITFIITDGEDNQSKRNPSHIRALLEKSRREEHLESLLTVLVGVTGSGKISIYLERFRKQACMDQYVSLREARRDRLAGLAGFMSRSICLTSRALGSGSAAPLTSLKI